MIEQTIETDESKFKTMKIAVVIIGVVLFLLTAFVPFVSALAVIAIYFGLKYINNKVCIAYDYFYMAGHVVLNKVYTKGSDPDTLEFELKDIRDIKKVDQNTDLSKANFFTTKEITGGEFTRYEMLIGNHPNKIVVDLKEALEKLVLNNQY